MEAGNTHCAQGRREEGWGLDSGTGTFRNPFLQTGGGWGQLCLSRPWRGSGLKGGRELPGSTQGAEQVQRQGPESPGRPGGRQVAPLAWRDLGPSDGA